MVRTGVGISIIPYQAAARDVSSGHLFFSRIEDAAGAGDRLGLPAHEPDSPFGLSETIKAFERVKPKLRLAP